MKNKGTKLRFCFLLLILFVATSAIAQFGANKEHLTIWIKSVPSIIMPPGSVHVEVKTQIPEAYGKESEVVDAISSSFQHDLPDVRVLDSSDAEYTLECMIDAFDIDHNTEIKQTTEYRRVGSKQVWNEKKQHYETKDDYQNVTVDTPVQTVSGNGAISYRLIQTKSGKEIFKGRKTSSFSQSSDSNTSESDEVSNFTNELGYKVASDIAPVRYPIRVMISKNDKLKTGNALLTTAEKNNSPLPWDQAARVWEGLSGLKPKDEAYRSFNLALAYEAIGNAETDMQQALVDLQKSQMLYKKAIELKGDEKYFMDPISRIQQSIDDIPKLERLYAHRTLPPSPSTPSVPAPIPTAAPAPAGEILTNQTVVNLVAAGLSESIIIQKIESTSCHFVTDANQLVYLKKHGVSDAIIAAMMQAPVVPLPQQPAKKKTTVKSSKS